MKKILSLFCLLTATVFAQKAETIAFIAPMSPASEVPAVNIQASGTGVLWFHLLRDASGAITSGSVDFTVHYNVPTAVTFTGLHIHDGGSTVAGPVVINTGIGAGAASVASAENGRGVISRQAQVLPTDATALALIKRIIDNPSVAYVNIHTTDNPGGVIRGQLRRAEVTYLMGVMSPKKEVPVVDSTASGIGSIVALRAFDPTGFAAGWVGFEVDYNMGAQATITGLHIHTGGPTIAGPVTISSGLGAGAASITTAASGAGNVTIGVEIQPNAAPATLAALNGIFDSPGDYYVNMHTTVFGGGVIRSQLSRTEMIKFPFVASPANEVPAVTGIAATGAGLIDIRALRDRTGAITAARVNFDFSHRFPAAAEITGLHIHDGNSTVAGPVTINTGINAATSVKSDTGFGNVSRTLNVSSGQPLASLNDVVINPENHYVNMHTVVNPGGVLRSALAADNAKAPVIRAVINGVSDVTLKTVAQGGLVTIFGDDLVKVGSLVEGLDDTSLPKSLDGTSVKIGGVDAPILWVDTDPAKSTPSFIVAQVPFETAVGTQSVVVKTANGTSNSMNVDVAAVAPGVFFDSESTIAVKASDFSLVRGDNQARAGDVLAIICTGLGQTNPALATGQVSQTPAIVSGTVTATIGGVNAVVSRATTLAGQPGYYMVLATMPTGVPAGKANVVVKVGTSTSNTTSMPVR